MVGKYLLFSKFDFSKTILFFENGMLKVQPQFWIIDLQIADTTYLSYPRSPPSTFTSPGELRLMCRDRQGEFSSAADDPSVFTITERTPTIGRFPGGKGLLVFNI